MASDAAPDRTHTRLDRWTAETALQEYVSLRSEILKRIEIQWQIGAGLILSLGAILTVGLSKGNDPTVLLIYPLLAFALVLNRFDYSFGTIGTVRGQKANELV
jgi:hypothetical protein